VPEVAVDEDSEAFRSDNEIRASTHVASMEAVPETASVQLTPEGELRFRVPVPDSAHHATGYSRIAPARSEASLAARSIGFSR
jgi:hypothetical protein